MNATPKQPKRLTITEVAARLRVTERTVGNYMRREDDPLPHIKKLGNRVEFDPAVVDDWFARQETKVNYDVAVGQ